MTVRYLGELNGICLLLDEGLIRGVVDRGRPGPAAPLVEEALVDLAGPARPPTDRWMLLDLGGGERSWRPLGFGRSLHYRRPGSGAAEVDIDLPADVLYRLHLPTGTGRPPEFQLSPDIRLSFRTEAPWTWDPGSLQVLTSGEPARVTLRLETRIGGGVVSGTAVVAAAGDRRAAYLARAALGRGFVRCHERAPRDRPERIVAVGDAATPGPDVIRVPAGIVSSADVSVALGLPVPARTLVVRDDEALWGPALHLSLALSAALAVDAGAACALALHDDAGRIERSWARDDLIGVVHRRAAADAGPDSETGEGTDAGELVVCESVTNALLGCQAVGYADWRGCDIAFIEPAAGPPELTDLPKSRRVEALTAAATAAVPEPLRRPSAATITVFTAHLPLHLTRYDDATRWVDRFRVAHLPGDTASILVPRHVTPPTAGRTPMSVVFDALSELTETESGAVAEALGQSLATPVLLSGPAATAAVLDGVLNRLDAELVLIIAHGRNDWIEDVDGHETTADTIAGWRLPGRPLIFNNSCSSWLSTGPAFVAAGARSYIGTLWPIASAPASAVARDVAAGLIGGPAIAEVLHDAIRATAVADPETALAYFLVGMPDEAFRGAPPLDDDERTSALLSDMRQLFDVLDAFAGNGRGDLAVQLLPSVVDGFRHRFVGLATTVDPAMPLPQPYNNLTMKDGDYLVAAAELNLLGRLAATLPETAVPSVLAQITALLPRALAACPEPARFASSVILPCAYELAEPRQKREPEALRWAAVAVELLGEQPGANVLNNIGSIHSRLNRFEPARRYFEDALRVAEPGSDGSANAWSNLAHCLRRQGDGAGALAALLTAFGEQTARSDDDNGSITAIRAVETATEYRIEIEPSVLAAAADCVARIAKAPIRVDRHCRLYRATALYHAGRGEHDAAAAAYRRIPPDAGGRTLNDLPAWYRTNGSPGRAARLQRDTAAALLRAGLPVPACEALIDTTNAFIDSYRLSGRAADLTGALDAADDLGELAAAESTAAAHAPDWQADIRDGTELIFQQLAKRNDIALAARAYRSVRAWRQHLPDQAWDLVVDALHPRNAETVRGLAAAGHLRRRAHLRIGSDLVLTTEVTTVRDDPADSGFPPVVIGLQPLPERCRETSITGPGRTTLTTGHAVYELRRGTAAAVIRRGVGGLGRAPDGTIGGHYIWGSTLIPYDVVVTFGNGLMPITMHADRVRGRMPEPTVIIGADTIQFEIAGGPDQRWLARLLILFQDGRPDRGRGFQPPGPVRASLEAYHRLLGFET